MCVGSGRGPTASCANTAEPAVNIAKPIIMFRPVLILGPHRQVRGRTQDSFVQGAATFLMDSTGTHRVVNPWPCLRHGISHWLRANPGQDASGSLNVSLVALALRAATHGISGRILPKAKTASKNFARQ